MTVADLSLTPKKYHVSIEYCVPCDYSAQVFQVTEELLSNYQHVIDRLELITGSNGAFEVLVDGETLFSKKTLKRHPEPQEVLRLFKEVVGPQVSVYPRSLLHLFLGRVRKQHITSSVDKKN